MENFAKETLPISLEEEMRRSYLDYAMSVIVSRALPDVRDGEQPALAPVGDDRRSGGPRAVVGDHHLERPVVLIGERAEEHMERLRPLVGRDDDRELGCGVDTHRAVGRQRSSVDQSRSGRTTPWSWPVKRPRAVSPSPAS